MDPEILWPCCGKLLQQKPISVASKDLSTALNRKKALHIHLRRAVENKTEIPLWLLYNSQAQSHCKCYACQHEILFLFLLPVMPSSAFITEQHPRSTGFGRNLTDTQKVVPDTYPQIAFPPNKNLTKVSWGTGEIGMFLSVYTYICLQRATMPKHYGRTKKYNKDIKWRAL